MYLVGYSNRLSLFSREDTKPTFCNHNNQHHVPSVVPRTSQSSTSHMISTPSIGSSEDFSTTLRSNTVSQPGSFYQMLPPPPPPTNMTMAHREQVLLLLLLLLSLLLLLLLL
jgi:hypothetical protein